MQVKTTKCGRCEYQIKEERVLGSKPGRARLTTEKCRMYYTVDYTTGRKSYKSCKSINTNGRCGLFKPKETGWDRIVKKIKGRSYG